MDEWASCYETGVMLDDDLEQAFDDGLENSCHLAFRVAYSVLRNREDAEEVAQEAMLKAHRKLRSLRHPDRLRAWLVRIAWRIAIDRKRSDRRRQRREQAEPVAPEEPNPEEVAAQVELRAHLWRAIDELPEIHRKTLILAAIEGHDLQTVARLLNLPPGTVKSRRRKWSHRRRPSLAQQRESLPSRYRFLPGRLHRRRPPRRASPGFSSRKDRRLPSSSSTRDPRTGSWFSH